METFAGEKFREFHDIATFCKRFICEFFSGDLYSVWAAICESFIREILNLNRSAKVSTCESFSCYSISNVAASVTTPTYHAHEPLGLRFLAKTTLMYVHM